MYANPNDLKLERIVIYNKLRNIIAILENIVFVGSLAVFNAERDLK